MLLGQLFLTQFKHQSEQFEGTKNKVMTGDVEVLSVEYILSSVRSKYF